jgi:hypothetical protein
MTDTDECAHEPCTCMATEGEYCGDYCREHSGTEEDVCACGHEECAGTAPV